MGQAESRKSHDTAGKERCLELVAKALGKRCQGWAAPLWWWRRLRVAVVASFCPRKRTGDLRNAPAATWQMRRDLRASTHGAFPQRRHQAGAQTCVRTG